MGVVYTLHLYILLRLNYPVHTPFLKVFLTCSIVVIWVNFFQTELMVEIYSKSLVRTIGKVLLMKFS